MQEKLTIIANKRLG